MSLDRSLKTSGGMTKHRNVLTRTERIEKLKDDGRFDENSPIHLPKVASRKVSTGKKKAAAAEEEE